MSDLTKVTITRADLADVVEVLAAYYGHADDGDLDAVVTEIDSHLHLVGDHQVTTALSSTTARGWIAGRLGAEITELPKLQRLLTIR